MAKLLYYCVKATFYGYSTKAVESVPVKRLPKIFFQHISPQKVEKLTVIVYVVYLGADVCAKICHDRQWRLS